MEKATEAKPQQSTLSHTLALCTEYDFGGKEKRTETRTREVVSNWDWTLDEDRILMDYITEYGYDNFLAGLLEDADSCRRRWLNHLLPDLIRYPLGQVEKDYIIQLHSILGNKWTEIAYYFPERTLNEIKEVCYSLETPLLLRSPEVTKECSQGAWTSEEDKILVDYIAKHGLPRSWTSLPKLAGLLRSGISCRKRWVKHLRPDLIRSPLTEAEKSYIFQLLSTLGNKWATIASHIPGRTDQRIRDFLRLRMRTKQQESPLSGSPEVIKEPSSCYHDQMVPCGSTMQKPERVAQFSMDGPLFPTSLEHHTSSKSCELDDITSGGEMNYMQQWIDDYVSTHPQEPV